MEKDRPTLSLPNERLKRERLLRGWTQADVAGFLGTDGYTVNRWERGRAHPSAYFRQKLCELFGKDLPALGLLPPSLREPEDPPEPASSAFPAFWSLPHLRNPCFTGREEILQTVHAKLSAAQPIALTQSYALHGLGGVGKTQLALEYAYRYAPQYRTVFWIEAETLEHIMASILRIAEILQLPERQEADQQRVAAAVRNWLNTQSGWLLIWDNLEDLELLPRFLPPISRGAVLLTTRCQALGPFAQGVDLAPMAQEEGLLFVLRRAKRLEPAATSEQMQVFATLSPVEYAAAGKLVAALGGLPLALDQAGAYLEETGCSFAAYLQRYEQQSASLLDRRGRLGGDHPHSVTATIRLAHQRVVLDCPAVANLLQMCVFLSAEGIPEELFVSHASCPASPGDLDIKNLYQLDQTIAVLRNFSLIQRHAETQTLSIHRLVQAVLQGEMSEQECAQVRECVLRRLHALFPEVRHATTRERCERLLPHMLACLATFPEHEANHTLAEACANVASYLLEQEQHEQSERFYQRVLRILEQENDAASPLLAKTLQDLALLYNRQGRPEQARPLYKQALCLREQLFGADHPLVAASLNVLAIHYHEQGEDEQAEVLYQRALLIREKALGPEHPLVSLSLNNLAELFFWQGKYEQAERLYRRALAILTAVSGPNEPQLWYSLDGLAALCLAQEKLDEAETLYRQALSFVEQDTSMHHLYVASPLHGLATLACRRGRYEEARALYQRALALREQYVGAHHPETAQTLNGLANLSMLQGKDAQAEQLYKRVLRIPPQRLRQSHPERARSLLGLARLSRKQGWDRQAQALFQQALTTFELGLGATHPETLQVKRDALLFSAQVESGFMEEGTQDR